MAIIVEIKSKNNFSYFIADENFYQCDLKYLASYLHKRLDIKYLIKELIDSAW